MAKYRDFQLVSRTGESAINWRFKAMVTEETGFLFWKKTHRRQITKSYAASWVFSDSGKYAPQEVTELCRMLESQNMCPIEEIPVISPS